MNWKKRGLQGILAAGVAANVVANFHAYNFTRFKNKPASPEFDAEEKAKSSLMKLLLFGIENPRPANHQVPKVPFETVTLQCHVPLEAWYIPAEADLGTIILFHGYTSSKSYQLDKAHVFWKLGYNTLLVDFMGSGGSHGNRTTFGFFESHEVRTAFQYIKSQQNGKVILFGKSMGAVSILKAVHDFGLEADGLILECPFGSMYQAIVNRFKGMKVPHFPFAGLLGFWGGVQNGFWIFNHKPTQYARKVNISTLLMYGEADPHVTRKEIDEIYGNLSGEKSLQTFPQTGHENYLLNNKAAWIAAVHQFLDARR